jgi:hypothetical protein
MPILEDQPRPPGSFLKAGAFDAQAVTANVRGCSESLTSTLIIIPIMMIRIMDAMAEKSAPAWLK